MTGLPNYSSNQKNIEPHEFIKLRKGTYDFTSSFIAFLSLVMSL